MSADQPPGPRRPPREDPGLGRGSVLAAVLGEVERERQSLAEQLDAGPVQTLSHLARSLRSLGESPELPRPLADRTEAAGQLAARVAEELRALARRLRPPLLDDLGLAAALGQLSAEFASETGIGVELELQPAPAGRGSAQALALFRVAQEALSNVERHAAARRVRIRLREGRESLLLLIVDDGVGFIVKTREPGPEKGLPEMRARLAALGGWLRVSSRVGGWTAVLAWTPLSAPGPSSRPAQPARRMEANALSGSLG